MNALLRTLAGTALAALAGATISVTVPTPAFGATAPPGGVLQGNGDA